MWALRSSKQVSQGGQIKQPLVGSTHSLLSNLVSRLEGWSPSSGSPDQEEDTTRRTVSISSGGIASRRSSSRTVSSSKSSIEVCSTHPIRGYHHVATSHQRHFSSSVPILSADELRGKATKPQSSKETALGSASPFEHQTVQDMKKVLYPELFKPAVKQGNASHQRRSRIQSGFPSIDEIQQRDLPFYGHGSVQWRDALTMGVNLLEKRFKNKRKKLLAETIAESSSLRSQSPLSLSAQAKKKPTIYFHQKHVEAALLYCGMWEKALTIGASKVDVVSACLQYKDSWSSALSVISNSFQNSDVRAGALSNSARRESQAQYRLQLAKIPAYALAEDDQLLDNSSLCRELLLKIPRWTTALALLERYSLRGGSLERQSYVDLAEKHVEPATKIMAGKGTSSPSQLLSSTTYRYHQWEIASRVFDLVVHEHEGLAELQVDYRRQGDRAAHAVELLRTLSHHGKAENEDFNELNRQRKSGSGELFGGKRVNLIEFCKKDSYILKTGKFASETDTLSNVAAQALGVESSTTSSSKKTSATSQWVHALLTMCPNPDSQLQKALYDYCIQHADWSTALRLHDYLGSTYESRNFAKELAYEQFRSAVAGSEKSDGEPSTGANQEVGIQLFESYTRKGIAIPTMGAKLLGMCVSNGSAWQGAIKVVDIMQRAHFNIPLVKIRDLATMLLKNQRHGEVLKVRHWVHQLANSGASANSVGKGIYSVTNFEELALKALSERSKSVEGRVLAMEQNLHTKHKFHERVIHTLEGIRLIDVDHIEQALDAVFWETRPAQEIVAIGLAHGLDLKKRPSSLNRMSFSRSTSPDATTTGDLIELLTLPPLRDSILYRVRTLHREQMRILGDYNLPFDSTKVMKILEKARRHDEWNYKKFLLSKNSSNRMRGQLPGTDGAKSPLWGVHDKLVRREGKGWRDVPTHEVDAVVEGVNALYTGREELLERIRESVINNHAYF